MGANAGIVMDDITRLMGANAAQMSDMIITTPALAPIK
jgi:hypothetical protein